MPNNSASDISDLRSDAEQVLGLVPPYSEKEARQAYRDAIATFHPDLADENGISKEDAAQSMLIINEAWKILRQTGFEHASETDTEPPDIIIESANDPDQIIYDETADEKRIRWTDLKEAYPILKFAAFVLKVMCFLAVLSAILGLTYRFYS